MTVSVVIPSYNSARTIRDCLRAVLDQTQPAEEVIVVDSSDDETPAIIREEFPQVKLIHLPEKTLPGGARNIGVEQAKGEVIAFTDADCEPTCAWLEHLVGGLDGDGVVGAVGTIDGPPDEKPAAFVDRILEFSEFLPGARRRYLRAGPTCNLATTREDFQRAGAFDTGFFPGEDTVFCYKLTGNGGRLRLVRPARVVHHSRDAWDLVEAHQERLGRAFVWSRTAHEGLPGARLLRVRGAPAMLAAYKLARVAMRLAAAHPKMGLRALRHASHILRGLQWWHSGLRQGLLSGTGGGC